jgi:hypothetical protein
MNRSVSRASRPDLPRRRLSAAVVTTAALLALPLLILGAAPSLAGDPARLERQMEIVEEAINQMLVDSPNYFVSGPEVTQSIAEEDLGVLFLFQASLTSAWWDDDRLLVNRLGLGSDDRSVIVLKRGDGDAEVKSLKLNGSEIKIKDGKITIRDKKGKEIEVDADSDLRTLDDADVEAKQIEKYGRAKEELIQVLIDYGEVLKAVPAGQSVRIVARFHDLDLPKDKMVRKLSVRAGIDDLRAYGDGKLSESEMRARVQILES